MAPASHPALRTVSPTELDRIAERVRPVARADEHLLPVVEALRPLLPGGGLVRGTTVACAGVGATSLTLALASAASAAGAWTVAVGLPHLGLVAASELGIDLRRLAVVTAPGPLPPEQWTTVVGGLIGAFDLLLVSPPRRLPPADTRRLAARARERGSVLLVVDPDRVTAGWAAGPDLRLAVTRVRWVGLGQGHGHLRARRVRVEARGRGRAARECRVDLWLSDPEGRIASVEPDARVLHPHFATESSVAGGTVRPVGR
jgi:hypothetical protein